MSVFHLKDLEKAIQFCNQLSQIRTLFLTSTNDFHLTELLESIHTSKEYAGEVHQLDVLAKLCPQVVLTFEKDIAIDRNWCAISKVALTKDLRVTVDGCNRVLSGRQRFLAFLIESGTIEFRRISIVRCGHSKAQQGGAIRILGDASTVVLRNMTFVNCEGHSGIIYVDTHAQMKLQGCVFLHCVAAFHGSCVFNKGYSVLSTSTFSHCRSGGLGGAVFNDQVASVDIASCDFRQCFAAMLGGAVFNSSRGLILLADNNWESNETEVLKGKAGSFYQEMD